jgi:hypothetical protein
LYINHEIALPHFEGLADSYSYKNKPFFPKNPACLPRKRLSRAMAQSHIFAENVAFGTNPTQGFGRVTLTIPTKLGYLEL